MFYKHYLVFIGDYFSLFTFLFFSLFISLNCLSRPYKTFFVFLGLKALSHTHSIRETVIYSVFVDKMDYTCSCFNSLRIS